VKNETWSKGDNMAKQKEVQAKAVQVNIIPTKETQSERIYANFLSVNHGPFDFTLTFCDTQPPADQEEAKKVVKEGVIKAPVQIEIAVPVDLIPLIIDALNTNYEDYLKTHGKSKE
jgi:hypothetical protein